MERQIASPADEHVLKRLEKSLDILHVSARPYDTKARIAAMAYRFTIGPVRYVYEARGVTWPGGLQALVGATIVVLLPIILFGHVLYPRYRCVIAVTVRAAASPRGSPPKTPAGRWRPWRAR